jgi:hypothetical protein
MTNKLKNIIKKGVSVLLEVDVADLPQKQVVKDKDVHDTAVAQATSDSITQKFRELGITVPMDELATKALLTSLGEFEISFKLMKPTKYFGGKTDVTAKAKVDGSAKGLRLFLKTSEGEKVRMDFDSKGLENMRPETGEPMTIIKENVKYVVQFTASKSDLEYGSSKIQITVNGKSRDLEVKQDQLGKIYGLTSNKGDDYTVAPNPKKQVGVKEGFMNVTLVGDDSDPQPNTSFAAPKSKLENYQREGSTEYAYFPESGKPIRVDKKLDTNQPITSTIMITSLPDIGKGDSVKNGGGVEFKVGEDVKISGNLTGPQDLSAIQAGTLDDLNKQLKSATATMSDSKQKDQVLKITLNNGNVVMLKPELLDPNPKFLGNWSNLKVEIGSHANNTEHWEKVMGTATLKLRK